MTTIDTQTFYLIINYGSTKLMRTVNKKIIIGLSDNILTTNRTETTTQTDNQTDSHLDTKIISYTVNSYEKVEGTRLI